MKHLKKYNESLDIDYDFLEDCFIELIDMGICKVNNSPILGKPAFGATILVSNYNQNNIWGSFSDSLIDEEIVKNKKEIKILELIKDCCYRIKMSGEYLLSYSLVTSEISPDGQNDIFQKNIIIQIVKK